MSVAGPPACVASTRVWSCSLSVGRGCRVRVLVRACVVWCASGALGGVALPFQDFFLIESQPELRLTASAAGRALNLEILPQPNLW